MIAFEVTREIPAAPAQVFDFLADGRRHAEWIAKGDDGRPRQVVETEHVSGPEVGEGATYHYRETLGGVKMSEYTFRTEVYEPPYRLVFRAERSHDILFDLEEIPAGTRLTCRREYVDRPRNLLGKLIARWSLKSEYAEPSIADDLTRIERALETRHAGAGSA